MAKINKLQKSGETIYPVTIHQAVVDVETDETLDVTLTNIKNDITSIKDGSVNFEELTPEQIAILKGEKGDKGDTGEKGEDGSVNFEELTEEQIASLSEDLLGNYIGFEIDEDMNLVMSTPDNYQGPEFILENGELKVVL